MVISSIRSSIAILLSSCSCVVALIILVKASFGFLLYKIEWYSSVLPNTIAICLTTPTVISQQPIEIPRPKVRRQHRFGNSNSGFSIKSITI